MTDNETKRRGRPRAYDPVKALRQARDTFWRNGYAGTSLDDIVAATGMNRPSLNAAFGDKRALYLAALRDYWDAKFVAMDEALGAATLEAALMRAYDASLTLYYAGEEGALGCFVVGTAITEATGDPEIRELSRNGFELLDARFAARFCLARDAGELGPDADTEALAKLATATMHTLAVRARSGAPCSELRQLAAQAIKLMCR